MFTYTCTYIYICIYVQVHITPSCNVVASIPTNVTGLDILVQIMRRVPFFISRKLGWSQSLSTHNSLGSAFEASYTIAADVYATNVLKLRQARGAACRPTARSKAGMNILFKDLFGYSKRGVSQSCRARGDSTSSIYFGCSFIICTYLGGS